VLAVVAVLHGLALMMAMNSRAPVAATPEPVAMQVVLMPANAQARPAPPRLDPPQPLQVQVVVPAIDMPPLDLPAVHAAIDAGTTMETVAVVPHPVAAPVNSADTSPAVLDASQVDYLRRPAPRYPPAARRARLQGTVLLWVMIGTDGRPQEVRVHRSSGFELLDREGREAVLHSLFRPYLERGVARMAEVIVPIDFSLDIRTARLD
jgi:protein TonB